MDQNKNTQGEQGEGQQSTQPHPTRDQAEGAREKAEGARDRAATGNMGGQERGSGSQGERTSSGSSGISNRGMSRSEEQIDLPRRGSTGEDDLDQSER